MISPALIIALLLVAGTALLLAEMFLPTHGILGLFGGLGILGAVGYCFFVNQWAGAGLFLVIMCVAPFAGSFAVKWWPRTPLGRRMVLQPVISPVRSIPVQLGQTGRTVTALRPTGHCDFSGLRLEVHSELGIIDPGKTVKVVAIDPDRITVRSA